MRPRSSLMFVIQLHIRDKMKHYNANWGDVSGLFSLSLSFNVYLFIRYVLLCTASCTYTTLHTYLYMLVYTRTCTYKSRSTSNVIRVIFYIHNICLDVYWLVIVGGCSGVKASNVLLHSNFLFLSILNINTNTHLTFMQYIYLIWFHSLI